MGPRFPSISTEVEELRDQVRRVLDSAEFAGAKQLQAFLSYGSEAFFQGRSSIEQLEIAREVLGRGEQFNPLDDPSVRKMASLLRQRLQRYYEVEGAENPIVISLPLRSYLPKFEYRDSPEVPAQDAPSQEVPVQETIESIALVDTPEREPIRERRGTSFFWLGIGLAVGCTLGYLLHWFAPIRQAVPQGEFRIRSTRGDIINQNFAKPNQSILLGPEVNESDEVVVRMQFRPSQPLHQAGLLLFDSVDNYVEFGRIFRGRPFLEFAGEATGRYQKSEAQIRYDSEAQTLLPVWLAIRRNGNEYRAFTSGDGIRWTPFGEPRTLSLQHPRVGLYALHGNNQATPEEAVFDHLSVGPGLHNLAPDTPLPSVFGGWVEDRTCHAVSNPLFEEFGVRFNGLLSGGRRCTGEISRPVPSGDWTFSTRLDFVPNDGLLSGLQVRGSKLRFRIVRWNMNGSTISVELVHKEQSHVADFAGNPPLILRIRCRGGMLQGAFSRDGVDYTDLPLRVPLASLGANPSIGYQLGLNRWISESAPPPPLVYWIHQDIERLDPLH